MVKSWVMKIMDGVDGKPRVEDEYGPFWPIKEYEGIIGIFTNYNPTFHFYVEVSVLFPHLVLSYGLGLFLWRYFSIIFFIFNNISNNYYI